MRIETLFAAALFTLPALAQMEVTVSKPDDGPATLNFALKTNRSSTVTGFPYAALDTFENVRSNGTRMAAPPTQIYRDSMGRMRTERTQSIPGQPSFLVVEILDPVAGDQYVLDQPHQTVHRRLLAVTTQAAPKTRRPCRLGPPSVNEMAGGISATSELLGSQVIEGVTACGDRHTLTYPPGSTTFGNDRPVSTVSETWNDFEELGKVGSCPKSAIAVERFSMQWVTGQAIFIHYAGSV